MATNEDQRMRRRRWTLGAGALVVALGSGAAVAGADGDLTITPSSGTPGTSYVVQVVCGEFPLLKQRHTQDAPVQMTIAPYPADQLVEVAPSVWEAGEVAGTTDEEYYAECGGVAAGSGRFDAESPHLWFGPRPQLGPDYLVGKTTIEGTDCPAGSEATVEIHVDGDILVTETATIDEYGDWTVDLPQPVGDVDYLIEASCGDVTYDEIRATTTTTSNTVAPELSVPTVTTPPTTPPASAAPATAQPGNAAYTG